MSRTLRILLFSLVILLGNLSYSQSLKWNKNKPFTTEEIKKALLTNNLDTIIIDNKLDIKENVDIPGYITLLFQNNGQLKIQNEGVKLTVNGPVVAGRSTIFDLSAKGVTSYDTSSISNISLNGTSIYYPEWWGWMPNVIPKNEDGSHPNSSFFRFSKEMMLDIAASGGGELQFGEGVYYMRDLFIDFDNCVVSGKGKSTILRFDRDNFLYTTRRGGLFTIQGPTLEKYQEIGWKEGKPQNGNFPFTKEQRTIENIVVKDLAIEWNEISASIDPTMNGLSVVNAKNVVIDNVHIDLFGANRAFYIGSLFDGDVTEDVIIKNCTGVNLRTGVLLSHGYDRDYTEVRNNKSLANITVENNYFAMVRVPEIDTTYDKLKNRILDKYSSGIFFIGNEPTSSYMENGILYDHNIGRFIIRNNTFENADFGIKSGFGDKREHRAYVHDVVISGNTFKNFAKIGVFSTFSKVKILDNAFNSKDFAPTLISNYIESQDEFETTAIHIAMAPWSKYRRKKGPENVVVHNNQFIGCRSNDSSILIQPTEESEIAVTDNMFDYGSGCTQISHNIIVQTDRGKFRTKRAEITVRNNISLVSNQSTREASIYKKSRRKRHITLIEK